MAKLATKLPAHLCESVCPEAEQSDSPNFDPKSGENAIEVGKLLLEARELQVDYGSLDLLYEIAVIRGQWPAVVWLVKLLIDKFHADGLQTDKLSQIVEQNVSSPSLDSLVQGRRRHETWTSNVGGVEPDSAARLNMDEIIGGPQPENMTIRERLGHRILGNVWHALGRMTLACATDDRLAGGEMRPEILEILALFHHSGLMPSSIYTYVPVNRPDAIQQPPMLHLLSSRILTALTDAAWRAHERAVIEEARLKGASPYIARPELPESSYRVSVSAVRPEVWLELILWSSLHGGWIGDGAQLLRSVCREKMPKPWQPISWRDSIQGALPFGQTELIDWDGLKHSFDTKPASSMDMTDLPGLRYENTISSELVNAYIEALLNSIYLGVGERGVPFQFVVGHLKIFRSFLRRSGLNLGGGTWDATLLRLVESQGDSVERNSAVMKFIELSPSIGEELRSAHTQALPSYVLDGSAAMLGLLHRTLRGQIKVGSISGALTAFKMIQQHVDDARRRSVTDFFESNRLASASANVEADGPFTSHFNGIEYPAFDAQIPLTTLGPFIDLVTAAGAFDFGRWLLFSDDIDGPVVSERLFADPIISPSLIRFATAAGEVDLLATLIQARVSGQEEDQGSGEKSRAILNSILDSQLSMRRWDSAIKILEHMRDVLNWHWDLSSLALLARTILVLTHNANSGDTSAHSDLQHAASIFTNMVERKYSRENSMSRSAFSKMIGILAVLSPLDSRFAGLFHRLTRLSWVRPATTAPFNVILDGVAETRGSAAARRLLDTFWTDERNSTHRSRHGNDLGGMMKMSRYEPHPRSRQEMNRDVYEFAGADGRQIRVHERLRPDVRTFRIILRKALEELRHRRDPVADTPTVEAIRSPQSPDGKTSSGTGESTTPDSEQGGAGGRSPMAEHSQSSPLALLTWAADSMRSTKAYNPALTDEDIIRELNDIVIDLGMSELRLHTPRLFRRNEHVD